MPEPQQFVAVRLVTRALFLALSRSEVYRLPLWAQRPVDWFRSVSLFKASALLLALCSFERPTRQFGASAKVNASLAYARSVTVSGHSSVFWVAN